MMPTTAHDDEAATGCELVRQRADALLAEFGALMADIAADPDRPDLARRMVTMSADFREHRAVLAGHALADELAAAIEERAYRRGRADERAAAATSGRRQGRHARSGVVLKLAPAVAAAAALARRSLFRHPVLAAARASLTAHKIAALATGAVAAGGAAAVLTVSGLGPNVALPFTGSGGAPAPAASVYAAVPAPSSSPIALLATHPKPKHAGRGKTLAAAGLPLPVYTPAAEPSSSSPAASPPSSSSAPAGPAALAVSTEAIDLSSATSATITLSASGAGWASWRIVTSGSDLDFSATNGVLQAGQSVTVTVSVDPAQALDGDTSATFTIGGYPVRVTLPAPVPQVAPSGSDSPSGAPTDVPTAPPSGSD